MTVNYLLSGLLFCSVCGVRMTLSSTTAYANKAGVRKKYAFYLCPRSHSGQCDNRVRVPEAWIRETVVGVVRQRLFPWR